MDGVYRKIISNPELRTTYFAHTNQLFGDLDNPELKQLLDDLRMRRICVLASHVLQPIPVLHIDLGSGTELVYGIEDMRAVMEELQLPAIA